MPVKYKYNCHLILNPGQYYLAHNDSVDTKSDCFAKTTIYILMEYTTK